MQFQTKTHAIRGACILQEFFTAIFIHDNEQHLQKINFEFSRA